MNKAHFILGFLKRAQQAGVVTEDNYELLKKHASTASYEAAQQMLPGALDPNSFKGILGTLVGSNALGAMLGSNYAPISNNELEQEMAYKEDPSVSKAIKYLIPGYAGYRAAKNSRLDQAYQKYKGEHRAANMPQSPYLVEKQAFWPFIERHPPASPLPTDPDARAVSFLGKAHRTVPATPPGQTPPPVVQAMLPLPAGSAYDIGVRPMSRGPLIPHPDFIGPVHPMQLQKTLPTPVPEGIDQGWYGRLSNNEPAQYHEGVGPGVASNWINQYPAAMHEQLREQSMPIGSTYGGKPQNVYNANFKRNVPTNERLTEAQAYEKYSPMLPGNSGGAIPTLIPQQHVTPPLPDQRSYTSRIAEKLDKLFYR